MMKYALVFWLKAKGAKAKCSVIETSSIPSTSSEVPDVGDIVLIEYGKKKYSAKILLFSEDFQFLNGLTVTEEGEILIGDKVMKKNNKKIKQKPENPEASEVNKKKKSKKGKQQEENVQENFQLSNGPIVTEEGETMIEEKGMEKRKKKLKRKAETPEASEVNGKEKSKKVNRQKEIVESKNTDASNVSNVDVESLHKHEDEVSTIDRDTRSNSMKRSTQSDVKEGRQLLKVGRSGVVEESVTEVVSTVMSNFQDQSYSSTKSSSSKSVSPGMVEAVVRKVIGELTINESSTRLGFQSPVSLKSERHRKRNARDDTSPKKMVELIKGSDVYVSHQELTLIKRWSKNPNQMIRLLMLNLVGAEQLKKSTARGKITCPNRKGIKMEAIPDNIHQTVKDFIDIHGVYEMTDADYNKVINQQCHSLRNPKKPCEEALSSAQRHGENLSLDTSISE